MAIMPIQIVRGLFSPIVQFVTQENSQLAEVPPAAESAGASPNGKASHTCTTQEQIERVRYESN